VNSSAVPITIVVVFLAALLTEFGQLTLIKLDFAASLVAVIHAKAILFAAHPLMLA